jgi:hypothetical protein
MTTTLITAHESTAMPAEAEMRRALETIVLSTRLVQDAIEDGDWAGALELDVRRQREIADFCAALEPRSCPADVLAALSELLRTNDALVGAVLHARRGLEREADTANVGRRAVAAYREGAAAAEALPLANLR